MTLYSSKPGSAFGEQYVSVSQVVTVGSYGSIRTLSLLAATSTSINARNVFIHNWQLLPYWLNSFYIRKLFYLDKIMCVFVFCFIHLLGYSIYKNLESAFSILCNGRHCISSQTRPSNHQLWKSIQNVKLPTEDNWKQMNRSKPFEYHRLT